MNKKDIFPIAKQTAQSLEFGYNEENRTIILSKGEANIVLVPYTSNSNIAYLYIEIFRWDIVNNEDKRADAINLINLNTNDCTIILLPSEEDCQDKLRMIARTEILLLSKSHFRRMLVDKINKLTFTRERYTDMLHQVLEK